MNDELYIVHLVFNEKMTKNSFDKDIHSIRDDILLVLDNEFNTTLSEACKTYDSFINSLSSSDKFIEDTSADSSLFSRYFIGPEVNNDIDSYTAVYKFTTGGNILSYLNKKFDRGYIGLNSSSSICIPENFSFDKLGCISVSLKKISRETHYRHTIETILEQKFIPKFLVGIEVKKSSVLLEILLSIIWVSSSIMIIMDLITRDAASFTEFIETTIVLAISIFAYLPVKDKLRNILEKR